MSTSDPDHAPDDDPTRALDDFVRRMQQPPRPANLAADLGDFDSLAQRLQPDATAPRPKGGRLRNGQRWFADDVDDVPVVDLPAVDLRAEQGQAAQRPKVDLPSVQAPNLPDDSTLEAATRSARDFAASQWDQDSLAADQPTWQPDPAALQLRPARNPRLLAQWQAGAWVGALRQVFDSATEFVNTPNGPAVQTYAPHQLLLLWPPLAQGGPAARWPQQAQLLSLPAGQAAEAALALLPDDARLWLLPDAGAVDWALGADIVLHHVATLRPFQADGLRAFITAEREADFARLNAGYHQPEGGGAVLLKR